MATALALAQLAKEPVPDVVSKAYNGRRFTFGPDYIIPTPFDPRLIERIPAAVAKAAMESGIAKIQITDWTEYHYNLKLKTMHTYF